MLIDLKQMLYDKVADQLIISHYDNIVKMDVVKPEDVGEKFKKAVQKSGSVKDLNGADWIIRFAEPIQKEPEQDDQEDQDTSTEDSTEQQDGNEDTETKDQEEVNEGIKVQDLTKSMLSNPKVTKLSCPCGATPKMVKEGEKKEDKEEKKDDGKKKKKQKPAPVPVEKPEEEKEEEPEGEDTGASTADAGAAEGGVEEAETQASGDDLKLKIKKALGKCFNADKDGIELVDVPECIEGYNVFYCKLSFKDHKGQTEEKQ